MIKIQTKYLWIGPAIGVIVGFLMEGDLKTKFITALAFGLFLLIFQLLLPVLFPTNLFSNNSSKTIEQQFISSILGLAAEMAKADGEISESEKDIVKKHLEEDFTAEKAAYLYKKFLRLLSSKNNINTICKTIEYEFDDRAKYHLIYVLVGIASADGVLSKKEISFLQLVAAKAHISIGTITAILGLFSFKRENQKQSNKNQTRRTSRKSQLTSAYEILEISENSDFDSIKSAYRKLAMTHHPDKVVHLGAAFQKKAKEKFQIILDAYDLLKQHSGN